MMVMRRGAFGDSGKRDNHVPGCDLGSMIVPARMKRTKTEIRRSRRKLKVSSSWMMRRWMIFRKLMRKTEDSSTLDTISKDMLE